MKHRKGDALHPNNLSLSPPLTEAKDSDERDPESLRLWLLTGRLRLQAAGDRDSDPSRNHQDRVFLWFM